jgi:hypothetical protein
MVRYKMNVVTKLYVVQNGTLQNGMVTKQYGYKTVTITK